MAAMIFPVLCFLLAFMQSAAGSLVLDVNPPEISPGLSQSLTVNCTFSLDGVSDVADIITLIIAKENEQNQFVDLVSLNIFTPDQITETTQLNDTSSVSGYIEGDGQSYLAIHWSFPTASEGGVYRCEVNGVDSTGHPIQKSQTMTVASASLAQLISKVSDLQGQLDRQETVNQNQSQTINTLLSLTQTQSNMISALTVKLSNYTNTITDLQNKLNSQPKVPVELAFSISTEYHGHYYLLSRGDWRDSNVAEQTCEDYGGYLVEINDADEHNFVKGFLDSSAGFTQILISGTDMGHSGQWIYFYSGIPLTYTDWRDTEPNTAYFHCIQMYRGSDWKWLDYPCHHVYSNIKFICEVDIN